FKRLKIPADARRMLRFDRGEHAAWRDGKFAVEAFFFEWQPGRSAATLARGHTPEVCLPSSGREVQEHGNISLPARGLELPFRHFSTPFGNGAAHVFYCLW